MAAKFEDLVKALLSAPNEFALSRLPFSTIQEGAADLGNRILALEAEVKKLSTVAPKPQ